MLGAIVIILGGLVTPAHAKQLTMESNQTHDSQGCMDKFVDMLTINLLNRALEVWPRHLDLDSTTLGKPGSRGLASRPPAVQPPIKPLNKQPGTMPPKTGIKLSEGEGSLKTKHQNKPQPISGNFWKETEIGPLHSEEVLDLDSLGTISLKRSAKLSAEIQDIEIPASPNLHSTGENSLKKSLGEYDHTVNLKGQGGDDHLQSAMPAPGLFTVFVKSSGQELDSQSSLSGLLASVITTSQHFGSSLEGLRKYMQLQEKSEVEAQNTGVFTTFIKTSQQLGNSLGDLGESMRRNAKSASFPAPDDLSKVSGVLENLRRNGGELDKSTLGYMQDIAQKHKPYGESELKRLLAGEWDLEWTTDKDMNFFYKWPFSKPTYTSSIINTRSMTMENTMALEGGAQIDSNGSIERFEGNRCYFKFKTAGLKAFGSKFSLPVPSVGAGFFETMYVDRSWLMMRDSRGIYSISARASTSR